jgi:hypothetical protein
MVVGYMCMKVTACERDTDDKKSKKLVTVYVTNSFFATAAASDKRRGEDSGRAQPDYHIVCDTYAYMSRPTCSFDRPVAARLAHPARRGDDVVVVRCERVRVRSRHIAHVWQLRHWRGSRDGNGVRRLVATRLVIVRPHR